MYGLSQNLIDQLDESFAKEVDVVEDQVVISKKAKRKLFKQKLYRCFKIV
ncbi:MAG: hypothetical protein HQM13_14925 [SAR324 cluster bacterium]|nr:hypothetical protein [SAR324 cluster bacterium]